jgi:oligopeptide transport system substrate-binding protein
MSTSERSDLQRVRREIRDHAVSRRTLLRQAAIGGVAITAAGALASSAAAAPGRGAATTASRGQEPGVFNIFQNNFADLDPQTITDGMWFVGTSLLEGLVLADEKGSSAIPGQAAEWAVSDDGLTYTFTIRDTAMWSNGDPVTANDFEWTYQRLLTPGAATGNTAGAKSYQQILGIAGASEFLSGEISDWAEVGIKATDERTLEIALINPNAEFLLLLTHPSMLGMWPGIEEIGTDWALPENFVGNGPFVPTAWVMNSSLSLAPNEHYWDSENVFLTSVRVQLTTGADTAISAAYEAGEVDAMALGGADLIRYQADPTLTEQLRSIGGGSVAYMALLRSKNTTLEDVRVREAIALAIDRETLAQTNPALRPGTQLVPDAVLGWDESLNVPFDPERAKQLLADAGFPDGEGFPPLTMLRGGTASVSDEALIDLIGSTLNIEVRLDVVEAGTYTERRWKVQEDDYIGFYLGSFGSQPTWSSWAANLWGPQFTEEFSLPSGVYAEYQVLQNDPDLDQVEKARQLAAIRAEHASEGARVYSAKVDEAASTPDPEQQIALFKEASRLRQDTYLFIPMWFNDQYWAVKPNIESFHLHPGGRPYYLRGVKKNG